MGVGECIGQQFSILLAHVHALHADSFPSDCMYMDHTEVMRIYVLCAQVKRVSMCVYMCVCKCVCVCACVYVYVHVCLCVCACTCVRAMYVLCAFSMCK